MLTQQPVQEPEIFFLINSTLRASPLPQQISPLCQLLAGIPVGSQGACSESPRRITELTQKGGSCCHRKNLIYCPVSLTWTCFCHKVQPIRSWRSSLITSKVLWQRESYKCSEMSLFLEGMVHACRKQISVKVCGMWRMKLYLLVLLDLALLEHGEHIGGSTLTLLLPPLGLLGCLWNDSE